MDQKSKLRKYTEQEIVWLTKNGKLPISECQKLFEKKFKRRINKNQITYIRRKYGIITGRKRIKPLGILRIRHGYFEIKVGTSEWDYLHLAIWETVNGPIPEEHIVVMKDGNRLNVSIDNLDLITRIEQMHLYRLKINQYPDELRPTIRAIAKLNAKATEAKKSK